MTHSITKSLILSCFDTLRVFTALLSRLYHGFESRTRYHMKIVDTVISVFFIFGSNILYLCNKDTVRRKHRMSKV